MQVNLKKLSLTDGPIYYEMILEIGQGENGFVNSLFSNSYDEFQAKLKYYDEMSQGLNLQPDHVAQTIYWLHINNIPVGYGKLRHDLNDNLKKQGGHIGYVIRPTSRANGYGKILLEELLKEAQNMELSAVLLTCDEHNTASRSIIEHNNGNLAEIVNGCCKYWIHV